MGPPKKNNLTLRTILPQELEALFPKLRFINWERRSQAAPRYNCMAFANGDDRHFWDPFRHGSRYYWPPNIRRDYSADAWEQVFLEQGYERTENREIEPGFEKVAIYVALDDMLASHVARSDGNTWLSKLGRGQDIAHPSLDCLEGEQAAEYGIVDRILKRPIRRQQ